MAECRRQIFAKATLQQRRALSFEGAVKRPLSLNDGNLLHARQGCRDGTLRVNKFPLLRCLDTKMLARWTYLLDTVLSKTPDGEAKAGSVGGDRPLKR